jgi:hypothetical protein
MKKSIDANPEPKLIKRPHHGEVKGGTWYNPTDSPALLFE